MKKLIILRDNEQEDALGHAFDIVGLEEFEVIRTFNYHEAEKKLLSFPNTTQWVILDQNKFFNIALRLLDEGLKIASGEIVDVSVIHITSYKKKAEIKTDVKLTLF